ncbi:alpha/beta fold hydrolase [Nocardia amikacinitolerans]|uniref:alpha/beta fold hydrolase n=1 Tax=Nocardia amikacinitolerans TaxID=756689 RepID=UPI003673E60A
MKITTGSADANGTMLAYTCAGSKDGTPVVLAHSLFMTREMMLPLVTRFADHGYFAVAYDHRGQGGSSPAIRRDLDLDTLTEDLAALITELGLKQPHVVGNSLGGMVALRLAAGRPRLLRTATAIGASAEEEYRREEFDPLVDHLIANGTTGMVDIGGGAMQVRNILAHIMFGDDTLAGKTALTERWMNYFDQLPPTIGDAADAVVTRDSVRADLKGCKVPVLAIAGEQDHAYPDPISGKNIAEAVGAKGHHVVIPGAGHSPALEQPSLVYAELVQHFARADA